MAALAPGSSLTLSRVDGPMTPGREEGWSLVVGGDERGRLRGNRISFDDLDLVVQRVGQRSELVTTTGTPLLRFDPAGFKATTLTVAAARYRLARQRPKPLLHRWRLTNDVHGLTVMEVTRTPLGTRLRVDEEPGAAPDLLALLAIGALVDVLDVEPAAAAA